MQRVSENWAIARRPNLAIPQGDTDAAAERAAGADGAARATDTA